MVYDIAHFWVALLIAVVLGICVGWFTRSDEPRHGPVLRLGAGWIFWSAVVFLVGLVLALVHAIPDRPGLWLETALLIFAAYMIGCPLPGLLPRASASQRKPSGATSRGLPVQTGRDADAGSPIPDRPIAGANQGVRATTRPVTSLGAIGTAHEGNAPRDDLASKPIDAGGNTTGIISDDPDSVDRPKST